MGPFDVTVGGWRGAQRPTAQSAASCMLFVFRRRAFDEPQLQNRAGEKEQQTKLWRLAGLETARRRPGGVRPHLNSMHALKDITQVPLCVMPAMPARAASGPLSRRGRPTAGPPARVAQSAPDPARGATDRRSDRGAGWGQWKCGSFRACESQ